MEQKSIHSFKRKHSSLNTYSSLCQNKRLHVAPRIPSINQMLYTMHLLRLIRRVNLSRDEQLILEKHSRFKRKRKCYEHVNEGLVLEANTDSIASMTLMTPKPKRFCYEFDDDSK